MKVWAAPATLCALALMIAAATTVHAQRTAPDENTGFIFDQLDFGSPPSAPTAIFAGTFSGSPRTTLTVTAGTLTGTISLGTQVIGANIEPGTTIISGSGSSWVVSRPQTFTTSETMTQNGPSFYAQCAAALDRFAGLKMVVIGDQGSANGDIDAATCAHLYNRSMTVYHHAQFFWLPVAEDLAWKPTGSGTVSHIQITNPGAGYSSASPPAVTFSGGSCTTALTGLAAAVESATGNNPGTIDGVTWTTGTGLGCDSSLTISIAAPPGSGVQATAVPWSVTPSTTHWVYEGIDLAAALATPSTAGSGGSYPLSSMLPATNWAMCTLGTPVPTTPAPYVARVVVGAQQEQQDANSEDTGPPITVPLSFWYLADNNSAQVRAAESAYLTTLKTYGYDGVYIDRGGLALQRSKYLQSTIIVHKSGRRHPAGIQHSV